MAIEYKKYDYILHFYISRKMRGAWLSEMFGVCSKIKNAWEIGDSAKDRSKQTSCEMKFLDRLNFEYASIEIIIDPFSLHSTDSNFGHLSNDTSTAQH